MRRILVAGASRGIGAALAGHFVAEGDDVITLSRSPSSHGTWHRCDLGSADEIDRVAAEIDGPLDALIVAAGIWERGAFTAEYDFETSPPSEIASIIAVNLVAPILLAQAVLPRLTAAVAARVVLIGSVDGLDGRAGREVAYSASKAGLRGAVQSLRSTLAGTRVSSTVINLATVATDEVVDDLARGVMPRQAPIPIADVIAATEFALRAAPESTVAEITIDQTDHGLAPSV